MIGYFKQQNIVSLIHTHIHIRCLNHIWWIVAEYVCDMTNISWLINRWNSLLPDPVMIPYRHRYVLINLLLPREMSCIHSVVRLCTLCVSLCLSLSPSCSLRASVSVVYCKLICSVNWCDFTPLLFTCKQWWLVVQKKKLTHSGGGWGRGHLDVLISDHSCITYFVTL